MGTLQRGGRGLQHLFPGIDAARQRDHRDLRMIDEGMAGRRSVAGDDVHHAFGEDVGDDLGKLQRRQRSLLGRFDDDRVAARQSRGEFPGGHHEGIVPRRDRAHHADGIAADHRGMASHVLARHGSMHVAYGTGKEAKAIGNRRHLVLQNADPWLAAIQRFENGEPLRLPIDGIGELQEQARALGGGRARPGLERLRGSIHRFVDLRGRGIGELDDRLLGLGIDHGLGRFGAGDEIRANQHLRVEHGLSSTRCAGLPATLTIRPYARPRASDSRRRGSARA